MPVKLSGGQKDIIITALAHVYENYEGYGEKDVAPASEIRELIELFESHYEVVLRGKLTQIETITYM